MADINQKNGAKVIEEEADDVNNEMPKDELLESGITRDTSFQRAVKDDDTTDGKNIAIIIGVIAGVFLLVVGGFFIFNKMTGAAVIDLDQLHEDNLEGELSEEEGYVYKGYSFVKVEGMWWTAIQTSKELVKIPLHFGPKELEYIKIDGSLSEEFNYGDEVYIAIDPTVVSGHYVVAMSELSSNIAQGRGRSTIGACTKEHEGCVDRKILNCENSNLPIIQLEEADTTGIELKGTCIKVKGRDYEIIKAVDRLLYQWYGIME